MSKQIVKFTDLQQKILKLDSQGFEKKYIASKLCASYEYICDFLNTADAQNSMRSEALKLLVGKGAKVAIDALIEIAGDKKANKQSRVSASDKLLHYTGLKIEIDPKDKSPSTMSSEELIDRLNKLRQEADTRLKPAVIIEGEKVENDDTDFTDFMQ